MRGRGCGRGRHEHADARYREPGCPFWTLPRFPWGTILGVSSERDAAGGQQRRRYADDAQDRDGDVDCRPQRDHVRSARRRARRVRLLVGDHVGVRHRSCDERVHDARAHLDDTANVDVRHRARHLHRRPGGRRAGERMAGERRADDVRALSPGVDGAHLGRQQRVQQRGGLSRRETSTSSIAHIVYAVIVESCHGTEDVVEFSTETSTHEMVESATDPHVESDLAWMYFDPDHWAWGALASSARRGRRRVRVLPRRVLLWTPGLANDWVQRTWSNSARERRAQPVRACRGRAVLQHHAARRSAHHGVLG